MLCQLWYFLKLIFYFNFILSLTVVLLSVSERMLQLQKNSLIAELKVSRDLNGIKKEQVKSKEEVSGPVFLSFWPLFSPPSTPPTCVCILI